jgi:hypothetical protein
LEEKENKPVLKIASVTCYYPESKLQLSSSSGTSRPLKTLAVPKLN